MTKKIYILKRLRSITVMLALTAAFAAISTTANSNGQHHKAMIFK